MKTRVVVVDDHTALREMFSAHLARWPNYEVAGGAGSGLAALALCERLRPDLVILDLLLPDLCGLEVLRRINEAWRTMRVLIYSATANEQLVREVLQERPAGFVGKSESLKTLREALDVVSAGGHYFTPFAARHLFEVRPGAVGSALSPREREILQMIAESRSSKEIAGCLEIAVKTVENHRAHLMEKLRLHDVASLTRYAMRTGVVGID